MLRSRAHSATPDTLNYDCVPSKSSTYVTSKITTSIDVELEYLEVEYIARSWCPCRERAKASGLRDMLRMRPPSPRLDEVYTPARSFYFSPSRDVLYLPVEDTDVYDEDCQLQDN